MKVKLIKKDDDYFLEVDYWHPKYKNPSLIDNTFKKPKGDMYNLSKQNCDEIFGVVDVEKLANKWAVDNPDETMENNSALNKGFKAGFNKAVKLNKGKVFTLEDMRKAITYGSNLRDMDAGKIPYQTMEEFIKSLQQPTEIEVEIEMEQYGYCEGCRKSGMWHCAHADSCGNSETRERLKLDSEGCLILKKI